MNTTAKQTAATESNSRLRRIAFATIASTLSSVGGALDALGLAA